MSTWWEYSHNYSKSRQHWRQQSGWNQEGAWQCPFCRTNNKPKGKACQHCGLRRFACAAAGQPASPASAAPSSSSAPCSGGTSIGTVQPAESKSEISAHIKHLEAALAALPDTAGCQASRSHLQQEIAASKRRITEMKPLGARIDACRGALERAEQRKRNALEQVALAQEAVMKAEKEELELKASLASLEALVAQESTTGNASSLTQLEEGMTAVISDMRASPTLDQNTVGNIQSQMQQLFLTLQALAAQNLQRTPPDGGTGPHVAAAPSVLDMLMAQQRQQPQPMCMEPQPAPPQERVAAAAAQGGA